VNSVFYPAGYNNVISVASTTTTDAKSGFSNYGSWIDISAPGSAIRSTYFNSSYAPTYANLDGTSMASPMVAGLCGLVKSVNPQMTRTQIENCVLSTATNINSANPNFIGQLGAGRINAYQAVLCAQATTNAPPITVIQADNPLRCPGGSIQFYGSSIGGLPTSYSWSFPGGNPATSTAQNPLVTYPNLGTFNVSLTLTNTFGSDTETLNGYVSISSSGTDVFFTENFEVGTFASNGWSLQNPDNATTWAINTVAGSTSGTNAAGINLFNYDARGQRDGLISPVLDFSNHSNIQLDF
jgi:PKD repeat protein